MLDNIILSVEILIFLIVSIGLLVLYIKNQNDEDDYFND